jgi:hypothetical protein
MSISLNNKAIFSSLSTPHFLRISKSSFQVLKGKKNTQGIDSDSRQFQRIFSILCIIEIEVRFQRKNPSVRHFSHFPSAERQPQKSEKAHI